MSRCNIVDVIREETALLTAKAAVVDGTVEVTYGELLDAVDRVTEGLTRAGLKRLDRVAFLCEDCADYIIGSLAILNAGGVVVPVSPSLMRNELEQVLERMDVAYLLYDGTARSGEEGRKLECGGCVKREFYVRLLVTRNDPPPDYSMLNPAFIRFSSGTTGTSKGVLLSHESILERTDAADQGMHITADDVIVWVLSMSFHFVVTILLYLRRGAAVVICRQPFPESFLSLAGRRHGTVFYASPFHYYVLAASPAVPATALSKARLAVSTAMKLNVETAGLFAAKFGFELAEAYGIIEVGLPCIGAGVSRRGCLGPVLPGYEVCIRDPDQDGIGLIHLRGKGFFDAYVSPWVLRRDALRDGWFNTGDMGRLDEDNNLFILGRGKTVINFAGMKVFPDEVEAVLVGHPAVRECLVYGETHPIYGQIPCAKVVLRGTVAAPDATELRRFCFARLAQHEVPKTFSFVDRLELTASGKLKRT